MFSRKILIDIDAILDTRYATIKRHYPEMLGDFDHVVYDARISELIFSELGIQDWDKLWAGRDITTLMDAQPTHLMFDLHRVLMDEVAGIEMSSPTEMPELTFNMYPYMACPAVLAEFKIQLSSFFEGFKVEVGHWDKHALSPLTLKRCWDAWCTYDWYTWIDHNASNFGDRIPNFVVYRPALLTDNMTENLSANILKDGVNPFTESKRFLAEYVTVECLDSKLFNVVI